MMRALTLSGMLLLSGCSLGLGGKPPPFLMTLSPTAMAPADAGRSVQAGDAITIAVPSTPQAIATTRVPVSDGQTAIAYVKDAAWVEPPARLFQRLMAETVRVRTGRAVLDLRQVQGSAGTQLSGQLLHFGVDAKSAQAIVIYDAALIRGKRLDTRRFEARSSLGIIDAASSGAALNRAANDVAGQVADWIGR
jgi:cholesterol transport system auxiliary component